MNEQQFWSHLDRLLNSKQVSRSMIQAIQQRLSQLRNQPTLPLKLIVETVGAGGVYLRPESGLNFPSITPVYSLTGHQEIALEMGLSNSAIALISGPPATGKTRIAASLADAAINHEKRILILSYYPTVLDAYEKLPGYPLRLNQSESHQNSIAEQLRNHHLYQPKMDYLPAYYLPDLELAKLRTPAKLETWLPRIENKSHAEISQLLQREFPDLTPARRDIVAIQLQRLTPLLKQQLSLSQLFGSLPETEIEQLAKQLANSPQIPILATAREFFDVANQSLWESKFDLVIVEESQYLSWDELILLAGLTQKLVLFGDETHTYISQRNANTLTRVDAFSFLSHHLLPAYSYKLTQQFRLHPEIAVPVYSLISNDWIQTYTEPIYYNLPSLNHRLVWQDVPQTTEIQNISNCLKNLPDNREDIGIIATSEGERERLIQEYPQYFIDTIDNWRGKERKIVVFCCSGEPQNVKWEQTKIALTRAKDYLIMVGDFERWRPNSPLQKLAVTRLKSTERTVILS
ncbi:MAG: hypothetical protein P5702_05140 [Limnospira sp. PMC 1291.21]|uniref:DNA2/NAM7 helicase-like C-terminal domain-containing protein n=4 Tax=Limnospira TaxID=2596745 RepID=A0A9P1NZ77_9CYAN|nr:MULTISPECIES: AAA domain-containing protein [Limnospira]EKD07037.1 hypothetical protein SPLC1_S500130 [Arthrospira platensis C1]MDC0838901.1 hypothetical protein [Limnoraphis robusta]EDZ96718.1 hypothetical protein AmaxDRAFT_0642 [Limnospira maxima CS-328]MDT9176896.1 hypothetical protein [Limnospira sp. PMC 1238.20]MDT9193524.1 hypothetical protein [Limnospira sp. PMC 1245.20]